MEVFQRIERQEPRLAIPDKPLSQRRKITDTLIANFERPGKRQQALADRIKNQQFIGQEVRPLLELEGDLAAAFAHISPSLWGYGRV